MFRSHRKTGFQPIVGKQSRRLILGSMPSERSLEKQQYYAHPRNAFWFIMQELLAIPANTAYQDKVRIVMDVGIVLWDVLQSCERKGSLDASIKNSSIVVNNFTQLLLDHPKIELIAFNGAKAEQEFSKRVKPKLSSLHQQIQTVRLPSSSPAMASLRKEEKLEIWRAALRLQDLNIKIEKTTR